MQAAGAPSRTLVRVSTDKGHHTPARGGERDAEVTERYLSSINNIPVSPVLPVSPGSRGISRPEYPAVYIGYRDGATSVSIKRLSIQFVYRRRSAARKSVVRGAKPNRKKRGAEDEQKTVRTYNRGKNKKRYREIYTVSTTALTPARDCSPQWRVPRATEGEQGREKQASPPPSRLGSAGRGRGHASRESVDSVRGIRRAMGKQAAHHGRRTGFTGSGARGRE